MKYKFDGSSWLIKLSKGDLLVDCLQQFIVKEQIGSAWVSGLGGVIWAELGYYDLENQEYVWQRMDDVPELVGLQGNIAWKGDDPILHLHGTLSRSDMSAVGGHIKELMAGGTIEVLVQPLKLGRMKRLLDGGTGLYTLDV